MLLHRLGGAFAALLLSLPAASRTTLRVPESAAVDMADAAEVQPLDQRKADAYLRRLIEALAAGTSYKVRLQAAVFLGRADDRRALDPLIQALSNDENHTVRAAAATALASLADPRAVSHILKRVAIDPDPFVREEAALALAKYQREEALPYVVAAYGSSENQEVRRQAVVYLAETPSETAQQVLVRALGDAEEIFAVAKGAALQMGTTEALQFLELALDHRDAGVRRGAVRVLHALESAEAAALILEVYERDIEADGVRNETRKALRDLRRFLAIEAIVEDARQNPHKHARAKALKLLGVIGGDEAEEVLLAALQDEDVYLRGTAVMAMAELGDPSLVTSLEKLEADPANQRILHLVRHTVKQLRKKRSSH